MLTQIHLPLKHLQLKCQVSSEKAQAEWDIYSWPRWQVPQCQLQPLL